MRLFRIFALGLTGFLFLGCAQDPSPFAGLSDAEISQKMGQSFLDADNFRQLSASQGTINSYCQSLTVEYTRLMSAAHTRSTDLLNAETDAEKNQLRAETERLYQDGLSQLTFYRDELKNKNCS